MRQNWGFSVGLKPRCWVLRVVVIGIGNQFIPVEGVDEAIVTLGRRVF